MVYYSELVTHRDFVCKHMFLYLLVCFFMNQSLYFFTSYCKKIILFDIFLERPFLDKNLCYRLHSKPPYKACCLLILKNIFCFVKTCLFFDIIHIFQRNFKQKNIEVQYIPDNFDLHDKNVQIKKQKKTFKVIKRRIKEAQRNLDF